MSTMLPITVLKGAVLAFALATSAQGQQVPEAPIVHAANAASAPAPAASAPAVSATTDAQPKCSLSWRSVAGAILGSATDKVASNSGSKVGIDGLGKPSGDTVQGAIAPGCVRTPTPSVLQRR